SMFVHDAEDIVFKSLPCGIPIFRHVAGAGIPVIARTSRRVSVRKQDLVIVIVRPYLGHTPPELSRANWRSVSPGFLNHAQTTSPFTCWRKGSSRRPHCAWVAMFLGASTN